MEAATDVDGSKHLSAQERVSPDARGDPHGDFLTTNEEHDLSRGLHQRHISLIALASAIVSLDFLPIVLL